MAKSKKKKATENHIREKDVKFGDKKLAIFKAMRTLKASGKSINARSSSEIAAKAKVTSHQVLHYCYHAMAGKLVRMTQIEGKRGNCFYLTKKGAALDLAKIAREIKARAK